MVFNPKSEIESRKSQSPSGVVQPTCLPLMQEIAGLPAGASAPRRERGRSGTPIPDWGGGVMDYWEAALVRVLPRAPAFAR
jgi:hypothetical protein